MAKTILISDRVNSFFTNNKIKAGTEIPTSGSYIKGDIIVNVGTNCANEPMWICTEDGNPGTWGLVGIGGGNNSLVSINESVTINTATSEVSLGSLAGLVSSKDKLMVHYNSAHLMEGVDFTFNSDYTKIVKVEGVWNSNNDADSVFTFELLKNVESVEGSTIKIDSKLSSFVNNVNISSAVTEVGIGIDGYNHESDMLMVFKNSAFIVEGVDYTVSGNKIVNMNGTWNSENSSNYSFAFVVFKEVAVINPDAVVNTENLVNGSVTMDKLADDVKQAIEGDSNIDLTNYQEKVDNKLVTVDKTIVGAINELFQNANNGKELIATAIGEPLNSSDTFNAMSNDINGLLSTFKTNMINKGVVVTGNETLSELILKIDEIKSGNLNIISATNLPAAGVDNQICVITDNPVDRFITTTNFDDTTGISTEYITLYSGNSASGTLIELNQGNLVSRYYFVKACQGENRLDSYYWLNNQWNRLTQSSIYFVENGVERNHNYFGGIPTGSGAEFNTNGLALLYSYGYPYKEVSTKNTINFSSYDKLDITIRNPDTSVSYYVYVGYASTDHFTSQGWYPTNSKGGNEPTYSRVTDAYTQIQATRGQTVSQTIDISSWTGEGWLFIATYNGNMDLYITDLKLY